MCNGNCRHVPGNKVPLVKKFIHDSDIISNSFSLLHQQQLIFNYHKTFFKLVLLNNREVFPPVQSVGLLLGCNRLADHAEYFSIDFFYN